MIEIYDIYYNSEAFPCGDDESGDVLLEHLYHTIDHELTQGVQDWEEKKIGLKLFVFLDECDYIA